MNALKNLIIALTGWAIAVAVGICNMIFGWGLWPKSWAIVILLNSVGFFVSHMFIALSKTNDE